MKDFCVQAERIVITHLVSGPKPSLCSWWGADWPGSSRKSERRAGTVKRWNSRRTRSSSPREVSSERRNMRSKDKGQNTDVLDVTSLSSWTTHCLGTAGASDLVDKVWKAPLMLLLRTWLPCLYDPRVPADCSCGCSWRLGEEGVDVNTRVLSAVTSACRTSIWGAKNRKKMDNLNKMCL